MTKKENSTLKQKKSLSEYITKKYLQLIDWASGEHPCAAPQDAAILLRALDGLTKQLQEVDDEGTDSENSMLKIIGLNEDKI